MLDQAVERTEKPTETDRVSLKREITTIAREMGIDKIGFTTKERLDEAPPSGDLSYVLPEARSAVSLLIAFDKPAIRAYLAKEDQKAHLKDHAGAYKKLEEAAKTIQDLLQDRGYETLAPFASGQYREGQPQFAMVPFLSHKYVAVASGIGWLGWSSNLVTPEHGAAVAITSVVTTADIEPDSPLPIESNWCEDCHLCVAVCPTHLIAKKEAETVRIAGSTHTQNKKATFLRCVIGCGGFSGVRSLDAKWSTWSDEVLDLPGSGDDEAYKEKVFAYAQDPENYLLKSQVGGSLSEAEIDKIKMGPYHAMFSFDYKAWEPKLGKIGTFSRWFNDVLAKTGRFSCGNCMNICWPDKEDRKENYRLLTTSGRVIRGENGPVVVR